eukprot:TRINITY_DN784_c0_g1_i1.p1 TRINITY_DN784_c0_g1~~TRINITY_DN784_c0_g1_i1.p1  ORF type:complete len:319 (-),score=25.98 TRINITY_DN784_c0_g1_i1:1338-2294(-)
MLQFVHKSKGRTIFVSAVRRISKVIHFEDTFRHGLRIELADGDVLAFLSFCSQAHSELYDWIESRLAPIVVLDRVRLPGHVAAEIEQRASRAISGGSPPPSKRITMLTIGSRGDIQSFIGLVHRLNEYGHRAHIATHDTFKSFVEKYGVEHIPLVGDPREIMATCVQTGVFTLRFFAEAKEKFSAFLQELLSASLRACEGEDVIIAVPTVLAGHHVAEKLNIPVFLAFPMPFSRTSAYCHPWLPVERNFGSAFILASYTMIEQLLWQPARGMMNRFGSRRSRTCRRYGRRWMRDQAQEAYEERVRSHPGGGGAAGDRL